MTERDTPPGLPQGGPNSYGELRTFDAIVRRSTERIIPLEYAVAAT
jgi:hypothetical protein